MYYLNPHLLYYVPVAAGLAALLVFANYRRKRAIHNAFGDWKLLARTSQPLAAWRYLVRGVLAAVAAASLILALARPTIPNGHKTIAEGKVDVIAVVDVSRSMAALDYEGKVPSSAIPKRPIEEPRTGRRDVLGPPDLRPPKAEPKAELAGSRLEMIRHIMVDYMLNAMKGNQLGIVSYAGEAFPQAFLTRDTNALTWVIDRGLTINSAPGEGSAMGKALNLSLDMFDADSPADHERIIILFSDGGNDDKPEVLRDFAKECKARNIKMVVVAMGNIMPSKIPTSKLAFDDPAARILRESGKRWYEVEGQIQRTGMDTALLQGLTNLTGGEFIHLKQQTDLNLLDHLGKMSMVPAPGTQELFPYLLLTAFFATTLTATITRSWRRKEST